MHLRLRILVVFASLLISRASTPFAQQAPNTSDHPAQLVQRPPDQQKTDRGVQHLIKLKVVVTDAAGKPVAGLTQADFSVADNGQARAITAFQSIANGNAHPADRIVLLLDTMNPGFDDVAFERKGITEFLLQDGGRLSHPTSLVILADSGVKVGQSSLDGKVLARELKQVATPIRQNVGAEGGDGYVRRYQASLRALIKLTSYEASLPGRVTILWFSPGWPMLAGARVSTSTRKERQAYFSAILDLTNSLREGGVTLDAIAPSALTQGSEGRADYYKIFLRPVPSADQADSGNLSLPVLALQSGGQYLRQIGTLPQEISACVADADAYYLLTFEAIPAVHPDEYHALAIKLSNSSLNLRTNSGYYAQP